MTMLTEYLKRDLRSLLPFERLTRREVTEAEVTGDALAALPEDLDPDRVLELHRPLSADERAALLGDVERMLESANDGDNPAPSVVRGLPSPPSRAARMVKILVPLAMAASVGLFVSLSRRSSSELPSYALEVHGGESETRGGAPENEGSVASLRVRTGSHFELVLRPQVAVAAHDDLTARIFVRDGANAARELTDVTVEVSGEGSVRVRGTLPAIAPGAELVALLGHRADVARGMTEGSRASTFRVRLDVY